LSAVEPTKPGRRLRRLMPKPPWVDALEAHVAARVPGHPNLLCAIKLVVITPLLVLALRQTDVLPVSEALTAALVLAFFALDYLDGLVARHRGLDSRFGRVFDRLTDYPLLVVVSWFSIDVLPVGLLAAKLGLDLLLLVLYALGRGSTENRLRTALSYTTLLSLLLLSQGWAPRVLTPQVVEALLAINVTFSAVVALYNLGALRKRFIADALSACNLACGVFAIAFAVRGRFEMSLLFVILGAAFDGVDGAAARRFGGTRFGVYSDDIADGLNYGIAPGVALYYALGGSLALGGGLEGVVLGVFYPVFTITRLVFFTLNKGTSDPNYFSGVPSPAGGLITMSSVVVFADRPAVLGLMVGIACAQMVSFETHYRHLVRALANNRRAVFGAPVYLVVLLLGLRLAGPRGAAAIILAGVLCYGFLPTLLAFHRVLGVRKAMRAAKAAAPVDPAAAPAVGDGEDDDEDDDAVSEPAPGSA
jgi:CDP-diacylglycerol--serine O-phosphatidyltransferase